MCVCVLHAQIHPAAGRCFGRSKGHAHPENRTWVVTNANPVSSSVCYVIKKMPIALYAVHPRKLGALVELLADERKIVRGMSYDAPGAQAAVWAGGNSFNQDDPPAESLVTFADNYASQAADTAQTADVESTRPLRAVTFGQCARDGFTGIHNT